MADLFAQMTEIFRGKIPDDPVHCFVFHRFLASELAFAAAAKEISNTIRDDNLAIGVWVTALPRQARAPYLKYPAPKKGPAATELAKRVADTEGYTLIEAEEAIAVFEKLGVVGQVYQHYGVEEAV